MTTLPRTTPTDATPDDPRLTAYTSGDLPHVEAAHFVIDTARNPEVQDDVARTHEFIAALEDALASEPLPQVDPPILLPRPAPNLARLTEPKHHPRRFALFPALASALAMAACLVMIAALLIPTVGKVRESSARSAAASNIRQIGQASFIYATDNQDKLPDAADLHAYAGQLAAGGGLNDASVWLAGIDERNLGYTTVLSPDFRVSNNFKPGDPVPLNPAFQSAKLSLAVPLGGITATMPSTTPIAWTRGLQPDGTWAAHSPWGSSGGHIVFAGGNVAWYKNLHDRANQLLRYDGKGTTSDIREALPPGTRIGEYLPTEAEQLAWSQQTKNMGNYSDSRHFENYAPLILLAAAGLGIAALIYLRLTGRISTMAMLGLVVVGFALLALFIPFLGRVR
ncbi:hypothetical protein [Geminisphaera colitermitum]|uniref:hypothetical protein n=1 Tax=Geminisphaera colitermitum TaxID=1148786 RepID=UPI00019655F4|nr:hypothetical protein [Geminisphaera colitermitum]